MQTSELRGVLREVDLFHGLSDEDLDRVAEAAQLREHSAGDVVFGQGQESDECAIIASGEFEKFEYDEVLEAERGVATLHAGESYGVVEMLARRPRDNALRAISSGSVLRFSREAVQGLARAQPDVCLALAETMAQRLDAKEQASKLPVVSVNAEDVDPDAVRRLPRPVIERFLLLPLRKDDHSITIGLVHPNDNLARNSAATFLEEFRHEWVCISQGDFDGYRRHHLGEVFADAPKEEAETFHVQYHRSEGAIVPPATSPAADLLDQLLGKALDAGASDVHFEPDPDGVNIRARIDGRMTELHPLLEFEMYKQLVARVKVISELNLAERRLPQDASLRLEFRRRMIDMRVSTLPTPTGEAVVLRLLDPTKRNLDLHELIVENRVAELVEELFSYPSGLVLVTGPTGSGKTTTLYGGMRSRLAATPTIKLVTAEDPVEYELEGVSQVQVNTAVGLNYERILRSLLRQDPDVLLIGEMRDEESMQIGLEASLTGHLVLSSLHTNNALETIMRLRQRGSENYVIAASLRGIVSQRLVARLCAACARPAELDTKTLDRLRASGVLREGETVSASDAPGCEVCRFLGRKGRVGLYEVLVMTDTLREAIESGASYGQLLASIPRSSYLPMRRYARHLIDKGLAAVEDMLPLFPSAKLREELDP